jgi:hypothetical protein
VSGHAARREPPASAGGATLQRRGKSRTPINRAFSPGFPGRCHNVGSGLLPASQETRTFFTPLATWENSETPRLKPEEISPTRAARLESRAPPHECGVSHLFQATVPNKLVLAKAVPFVQRVFRSLRSRAQMESIRAASSRKVARSQARCESQKRTRAGRFPALVIRSGGRCYSVALGLIWATVQTGSPTLKRAKRRTLRFSPSLPIFCAIRSLMAKDWSLMKG